MPSRHVTHGGGVNGPVQTAVRRNRVHISDQRRMQTHHETGVTTSSLGRPPEREASRDSRRYGVVRGPIVMCIRLPGPNAVSTWPS